MTEEDEQREVPGVVPYAIGDVGVVVRDEEPHEAQDDLDQDRGDQAERGGQELPTLGKVETREVTQKSESQQGQGTQVGKEED